MRRVQTGGRSATVEDEPRVLDTDLAEALGFSAPRQIRELIKRHISALEDLGFCRTVRQNTGQRGRPAAAICLNKPRAIFITTQSGTPTAIEVTVQVIKKFDAYEHGMMAAFQASPIEKTRQILLRAGGSGAATLAFKFIARERLAPLTASYTVASTMLDERHRVLYRIR